MDRFMAAPFELLLGRRTYDIFAAYWPNHKEVPSVAKPFNSAKKYVVSHKPFELSWNNSVLITGDVVAEIKKLKNSDGPDLWVYGSGNLIQTLLKHNLIDRMHIWTFPVTIGTGKKLFAEGTQPERFKPVDCKNYNDRRNICNLRTLKPAQTNIIIKLRVPSLISRIIYQNNPM